MNSFPGRWKAVLAVVVLALLIGGVCFYHVQEQRVRQDVESDLFAITELKAGQIAAWRAERLGDASLLAESVLISEVAAQWMETSDIHEREMLLASFRSLQKNYHYEDVLLVDTAGRVRLSLSGKPEPIEAGLAQALSAAWHDHKPVFSDLYTDKFGPSPHLSVVAPLLIGGGETQKPVGAAILVSNARQFLYPLIESWPVPSKTAETLLVRRDGNDALFLNELRHQTNTALKLRIPLGQTNVPAVMAVLGKEGIVQGLDYRGAEVLAALKHIPDSPWFIEAKMDQAEAFADWQFDSGLILALLLALVALAGAVMFVLWQRNQKAHYRALYQAEAGRQTSEKRYGVTLKSIGDAVITADAQGRVELLNPVAEMLTGWKHAEARGKPLEEVFRIVNEDTRQPVENPVTRVMREGMVMGLANHTLLIARDGAERPIADSGAPIRDEQNRIAGVVLVFREQTEERAMQQALRNSERKYRELVQNANSVILRWNAKGCITFLNEFGQSFFGYPNEEILNRHVIGTIVPETESTGRDLRPLIEQICANPDAFAHNVNENILRDGRRVWMAWNNKAVFDAQGRLVEVFSVGNDITERKRAETELRRSNRAMRMFSLCNQEMVRATDETALLQTICQIAVEHGGYRMAWVGFAEQDEARSVRPVTQAGFEEGYLDTLNITWADAERGRGPTGMAIRNGQPVLARNILTDPAFEPWRAAAIQRGYASSIALPLHGGGRCFGALMIYAAEPDAFDADEIKLLGELANDLAYGIGALRHRAERKRAEAALHESEARYRAFFDKSADGILIADVETKQFKYANPALCRMLGYTENELRTMGVMDIHPKDVVQSVITEFEAQVRGDKTLVTDIPCLRKDGSIVHADINSAKITVDGRPCNMGFFRDITERKRMEVALSESRNFLDKIINSVADPIFVKNQQHRWVLLNEAFCDFMGHKRNELLGKSDYDFFPKNEAGVFWAKDEIVFTTGIENINEEKFTEAKGTVHTIVTKKTLYTDENGGKFIVGIISDITERKRTEEALRESEERYRAIMEQAADAVFMHDKTGRILDVNQKACQSLGYTREELLSKSIRDIDPEAIQAGKHELWDKVLAGEHFTFESHQIHKDGIYIPVEVSLGSVCLPRGLAVIGIARNITERKRAQVAVEESRQMLQLILDTIPVRVFWKDLAGRYIGCNHPFARDAGFDSPGALVGKDDYVMGWKDQADLYRADDQKVIASGVPKLYYEEPQTTPAGKQMWLRTSKIPLRDAGGRIIGILGAYEDITERKRAEERIREQAALLDAASDAIYVYTLDQTLTYWNDSAERLYGWTRAETLGRKITELRMVDPATFEEAHSALREQGHWSGELKTTDKAGKEFVVFCRWTMMLDVQNQPKEILAINTDITERKQLETNFLRAQRMEGIGALAGGIAHDLNNILQPILMTVPLLRETTGDPESREMLDTVNSCAQRGADIIKQLLTFARGEPGARVPMPTRHILNELNKLMRETFPKNIQLRVNVPKNLWQVLGDVTQIHQALMNLCVNARDAMSNGGTLTLAAENLTLDEAFAAMTPSAKPGPYICVSVTDTGMGIPPENLDRIFDPFFTTKEIGKGTGLGLATVLGVARGHGGFVRVNSQVGKGTIFELYLPASLEAKAAALPERETLPPRAAGELILVVDDEASVRGVVGRTLEKHGYRVVPAAEGVEAMGLFAQHRAEIRAVLTDMMMPDMDGPSLVRALRHLEPQLPILGMTGVGEKADIKGLETLGLLVLLTKPFNSAVLLDVLHQALAAPRKDKDAK
ncbi:MAG: PAS domain S-box protein [Verrucomicrobiota bacterium]|jgi:PAS domain S-box-containing protein